MKLGLMFYRFGALGLLFSAGVFFEEPLKTYLAQNHSSLTTMMLLYCFPILVGFTLLMMTGDAFQKIESRFALLFNALSVLTLCWLALWWVLWTSMAPQMANSQDLFLKYLTYLNLLGLGIGLAAYLWGYKTAHPGIRVTRFIMAAGWTISYTSAINLHLQPTLRHFMGPGVGGLLVVLGALLISQDLD
ncbi:MAG TPA: hypothetical protein VIJ93_08185 [bacterium]